MGITMVLSLLSGVALFLYGMSLMGDSLKKVAGNKLELILYRLTNTPLKGLLLGTVVTAIIQSSSATTVMAPFIIGIIGGTTIIAGGTYLLEKIAEYIEQNNQTKSI